MPTLSFEELAVEHAELLPKREALTFVKVNWANVWANNTSVALNAGSINALAASAALQGISVSQS